MGRAALAAVRALIPVAYLLKDLNGDLSSADKEHLRRFLLITGCRGMFQGSVETTINTFITPLRDATSRQKNRSGLLLKRIPQNRLYKIKPEDVRSANRMYSPLMQVYLAYLVDRGAQSWPSGRPIRDIALKDVVGDQLAVHHIFPKKFMQQFDVPTDAAQFWTAAAAIATALAVWFAYVAVVYAARALRLEQTPIIMLQRVGDRAELRNTGRGTGLSVLLTDDEGDYLLSASSIPADAAVPVNSTILSDADGYYIYAQDLSGRWFCTRAVYNGFRWSDGSDFTNGFRGRISGWRVPRKALRELRQQAVSEWEYFRAVTSYFTARGWALRFENWWVKLWIAVPRWLENWPEARRAARYGARPDRTDGRAVSAEIRAQWAIDVDGMVNCWKGPRLMRQFSCEWENDGVVCEVEVRPPLSDPARGLLRITRRAFDRLPENRDRRNEVIRRRFDNYVCRLRPTSRFVFSLRTLGPFIMNLP